MTIMNPFVRDLYKRILYAGREYPAGLSKVRIKAKEAFYKNKEAVNVILYTLGPLSMITAYIENLFILCFIYCRCKCFRLFNDERI